MISVRVKALASTVLLVVGALLVGEAIHAGVVTGTHAVTSPYVVLQALLGAAFMAVGQRFRTRPEEYLDLPSGESGRERSTQTDADDFDPELSPLGDEGLERVDAGERADASDTDGRADASNGDGSR